MSVATNSHGRPILHPAARQILILWLGQTSYASAHRLQHLLVQARAARQVPDILLLLEHHPTVTWGRQTEPTELQRAGLVCKRQRIALVECERAGRLTFHGPGQLVAYPIVHLDVVGRDLHRWLDTLEAATAQALASYAIQARPGGKECRGVWVRGRKIASLGIAVRRWVSYHGICVNVSSRPPDGLGLTWCGLEAGKYTSLADLGVVAEVKEVGRRLAEQLCRILHLSPVWLPTPRHALTVTLFGPPVAPLKALSC